MSFVLTKERRRAPRLTEHERAELRRHLAHNHFSGVTSTSDHVRDVVQTLFTMGCRTATKYVAPDLVVRATYRFKPHGGRRSMHDIVLSVCRPNVRERAIVKKARKHGDTFPLNGFDCRWWPKKKKE